MPNLPAPAPRCYIIPPELDRLLADDSFWESLDGESTGLDRLDQLAASLRLLEPEPFQAPAYTSEGHSADYLSAGGDQVFGGPAPAPPLLPTAEWLRVQAAYFRSLDEEGCPPLEHCGPGESRDGMAIWLSVRIDQLADEWERFGATTVRQFRKAEVADIQATYRHHQDVGRVTGLGGESRASVIERIAAFD